MPAKYLLCQKTGGKCTIEDCKVCDDRCLSLPTLVYGLDNREWTGKPSVTQLIEGTRMAYLKLTEDYTINPIEDIPYKLLGTRHHKILETVANKIGSISEKKLDGEVSGILDLLEDIYNLPDVYDLWDYKCWGSYQVAKVLGIKPIKWGDGHPIEFGIFPDKADAWEVELQLNKYRIEFEALGFKIRKIYVQATVKDGRIITAINRGVTLPIYKIHIKRLEDDYVRDYFKTKSVALLEALDKKVMPLPCSNKENWYFRKCKEFCPVAEFCDVGIHQRGK